MYINKQHEKRVNRNKLPLNVLKILFVSFYSIVLVIFRVLNIFLPSKFNCYYKMKKTNSIIDRCMYVILIFFKLYNYFGSLIYIS